MAVGEQLREKVLVVDDEPAILTALEDALGDNFDVVATDKPERAVELAENDPELAVVLSDQRMPGMTGDALFSRIRNRSDATRVLATGYADLSAVIRAVNDGNLFGYITKPWNRNELNLSVQRAAEHFRLRRRLFEEHQLLENLMQNMPDAIFFQDAEQRFTRVNEAFLRLSGSKDQRAVVGRSFGDLRPTVAAAAELERQGAALLRDGEARRDIVHEQATPEGSRWFSTTEAALRGPTGQAVGLGGGSREITQRVRPGSALRTSGRRLRRASQASGAGLCDWNMQTGNVVCSAIFGVSAEVTGLTRADLSSFIERIHPDDVPKLQSALRAHLESRVPVAAVEARLSDASGDCRWFEVRGQAAWSPDGKPLRLVGSCLDITARKEHAAQSARLDFLAHHDTLTGLPNRAFLETLAESQLALAREHDSSLAIAIIDVARLRLVNETLGRHAGDELLKEIAVRLSDVMRPSDTLARHDSASFAVLLNSAAQPTEVASWLEHTVTPVLSEPFSIGDSPLRMAFKIGIAVFPTDGQTADELMAHAESALKKAKA